MIDRNTIRELFEYNDWARDHLLARAATLGDDALDRRFEMGEGSLRATLRHLAWAECIWLCRWQQVAMNHYGAKLEDERIAIPQLAEAWKATAARRDAYLVSRTPADLAGPCAYTNFRGEALRFPLGDLMLHVCNHGMHHRAQALNMLRHLGAPPFEPGLDYIFMKRDRHDDPPPAVSADAMRTYLGYSDWATQRVLDAGAGLSDAQLDRGFEMGEGTLRRTLLHIRFADQWWLDNWSIGPNNEFPEEPPTTSWSELQRLVRETAAARQRYLATLADAALVEPVEIRPRPGVVRHFPLSVTMLQVCNHGTHHRAQALNMLRHLGAPVPGLDYARMLQNP